MNNWVKWYQINDIIRKSLSEVEMEKDFLDIQQMILKDLINPYPYVLSHMCRNPCTYGDKTTSDTAKCYCQVAHGYRLT